MQHFSHWSQTRKGTNTHCRLIFSFSSGFSKNLGIIVSWNSCPPSRTLRFLDPHLQLNINCKYFETGISRLPLFKFKSRYHSVGIHIDWFQWISEKMQTIAKCTHCNFPTLIPSCLLNGESYFCLIKCKQFIDALENCTELNEIADASRQ